jgi:uncharacterized membrane protein
MQSTARLMDHPIHPMIIPYPFAFLSGAAAFDIAASLNGNDRLGQTAGHLRTAGVALALAAAVPGFIDYLTAVPGGQAKNTATKHMVSNVSALACFAAAVGASNGNGRPSAAVLALELVGTAFLSIGGWLGGNLVYRHQVGVDLDETRRALPEARAATRGHAELA